MAVSALIITPLTPLILRGGGPRIKLPISSPVALLLQNFMIRPAVAYKKHL